MIRSELIRKILLTDKWSYDDLFTNRGRIYTFVNPVSYLIALKNKELFVPFDGLFADGSLMVAAIKICYWKTVARKSLDMTSIAPRLFEYAAKHHSSICVIAAKQTQMENSIAKLAEKYPDIEWRGCRNGYFDSNEERDAAVRKIVDENADFLIVGMGSKLQEYFLLQCREAGYKGIGFTCGGFIHQYANHKNGIYYPDWADRMNLRFLYRMYKEPYTRKRYAIAGLVFPLRFLLEKITGK